MIELRYTEWIEIDFCVHPLSLDDSRSLESAVMHELLIADRILFEGRDFSFILHHHRHLCRLRSGSGAYVEDERARSRGEDEHGKETRE